MLCNTFFFAKTVTYSLSCLSCIIWGRMPTLPSTQIRTILTWLSSPRTTLTWPTLLRTILTWPTLPSTQNHPHLANAIQPSNHPHLAHAIQPSDQNHPHLANITQPSDQNHPHLANTAQHVLTLPPLLAAPAQTERAALGTSDTALKLQLHLCSRAGCVRV